MAFYYLISVLDGFSRYIGHAKAARPLMNQLTTARQPRLEKIWADSKYHNHSLYAWLNRQKRIAWELEIVRRPPGVKGFVLLHKRWVAERTFAWLGRWRRLSRDYEHRTASNQAMVKIASIGRMLRYMEAAKKQTPFKYRVANQVSG